MSKKIIVALLTALATAPVIAADSAPSAIIDTDKNGTLSKEEAKAVPGLIEQWTSLDANADGQLDHTEFSKFVAVEEKSKTKVN